MKTLEAIRATRTPIILVVATRIRLGTLPGHGGEGRLDVLRPSHLRGL